MKRDCHHKTMPRSLEIQLSPRHSRLLDKVEQDTRKPVSTVLNEALDMYLEGLIASGKLSEE